MRVGRDLAQKDSVGIILRRESEGNRRGIGGESEGNRRRLEGDRSESEEIRGAPEGIRGVRRNQRHLVVGVDLVQDVPRAVRALDAHALDRDPWPRALDDGTRLDAQVALGEVHERGVVARHDARAAEAHRARLEARQVQVAQLIGPSAVLRQLLLLGSGPAVRACE